MAGIFRTHYDNLKVARTAPPEVIAAAYRALSKQLHPDINKGGPQADQAMRIVNASYAVLSDPAKRRDHDDWIRTKEEEQRTSSGGSDKTENTHRASVSAPSKSNAFIRHVSSFWALYLIAGVVGIGYFSDQSPPAPSGLPQYVASPSNEVADGLLPTTPVAPPYARPSAAPNGKAWPTAPAYVTGYSISRTNGLSQLTIDNQSNSTDMFVKLVALDVNKTVPIRYAYIPAHQAFTMHNIRSGHYDIRYMDLSDGSLSRSESFELKEIRDALGVNYSVTTMTLYKVSNGNMQTYPLAPNEF